MNELNKTFFFRVAGIRRVGIPAKNKIEATRKLLEQIAEDESYVWEYTYEDNSWISGKVERMVEE